eukprot:UN23664
MKLTTYIALMGGTYANKNLESLEAMNKKVVGTTNYKPMELCYNEESQEITKCSKEGEVCNFNGYFGATEDDDAYAFSCIKKKVVVKE